MPRQTIHRSPRPERRSGGASRHPWYREQTLRSPWIAVPQPRADGRAAAPDTRADPASTAGQLAQRLAERRVAEGPQPWKSGHGRRGQDRLREDQRALPQQNSISRNRQPESVTSRRACNEAGSGASRNGPSRRNREVVATQRAHARREQARFRQPRDQRAGHLRSNVFQRPPVGIGHDVAMGVAQ